MWHHYIICNELSLSRVLDITSLVYGPIYKPLVMLVMLNILPYGCIAVYPLTLSPSHYYTSNAEVGQKIQAKDYSNYDVIKSWPLNSAQNQRHLSLVTLKLHGWPRKTIGHLFYATSRVEHHFIAIWFKLELQSEKSQFGSKSIILLALWPWNLMDDLEK